MRELSARKRLDQVNRREMLTALANELRRLNLPPGEMPSDMEDSLRRLAEAEARQGR
jgi:hypothetical protein